MKAPSKFKFAWFALVLLGGLVISQDTFSENLARQNQQQKAEIQETELLTIKTGLGVFDFNVEVADTAEERSIGLMNRQEMEPKHGMLFDFGRNDIVTMWMKNTYISLDMIFIKENGAVVRVAERTTPQSTDIITSGEAVKYVLELNAGISRMIGLKPGDQIIHRLIKQP